MVELTSDDIGAVFEQNKGFRLQPYTALVSGNNSLSPEAKNKINLLIDLKDGQETRKILCENGFRTTRLVSKLAVA
jgi:hypothetical protein